MLRGCRDILIADIAILNSEDILIVKPHERHVGQQKHDNENALLLRLSGIVAGHVHVLVAVPFVHGSAILPLKVRGSSAAGNWPLPELIPKGSC